MNFEDSIFSAVRHFWTAREHQRLTSRQALDNRSAVAGGKQMDGFIHLLQEIALQANVPASCIFLKGTTLPGFFRPNKMWDIVIVSPRNKLIAAIELKSQVGSFGNNFNNRSEEAIGSAHDFWVAFREGAFPTPPIPWLGFMILVEKTSKSHTPVKIPNQHFEVFPEFEDTSYLDRYHLLCIKMVRERLYSSCGLIWTTSDLAYGKIDDSSSLQGFLLAFSAHLQAQIHEF